MENNIDDLVKYIQTVPKNSNRYLWAKRLIEDLSVPDGMLTEPYIKNQLPSVTAVKVVYKGKVFKTIRAAAKSLFVRENSLRNDIHNGSRKYEVYILQ